MAKHIEASLRILKNVFSNSHGSILEGDQVFTIPPYQRAYNWRSNDQCERLWQDILDFMDKDNETYFFGTIIINKEDNKLNIIDGQQRITTFMLLLKALHIIINETLAILPKNEESREIRKGLVASRRAIINCLYKTKEEDIDEIVEGIIKLADLDIKYQNESINEEFADDVKVILCGNNFDEIFENVIDIKGRHKDNRLTNFFKNFRYFYNKLQNMDSTLIDDFAKTLLGKCEVIVVVSYRNDEAIEIFNSLNSTGLPLTDADIVSAGLYKNYDDDKTGFIENWKEIIRDTNNLAAQRITTIDEILNQYMYILRAINTERDSSLPSVRKYFTLDNKDTLRDPAKFISDFKYIISIWQGEGYLASIDTIRRVLHRHNGNFKFFFVTYLFILRNEAEEKKKEFAEALLKLFALLNITEHDYSSAFFKIYLIGLNMKMGLGATTDDLVKDIENHINEKFSRVKVMEELITSDVNGATVYLNEYLFAKEKGKTLNLNLENIEIEHILPVSTREKDAIRLTLNISAEEFEECVDKLGNKILLEKKINTGIGANWFVLKKDESIERRVGYKDSVFPIAQELTSYPEAMWGKADIDKATEKAAKRITDFIFGPESDMKL